MPGMIALLPADPAALVVDAEGAEPADQIHVTLLFLGDDAGTWPAARVQALVTLASAIAATATGPITAGAVGHATFGPGTDRQCAVHLIGDSALLAPLHDMVTGGASSLLGDALPVQHQPWLPHATAGYGLTAADLTYTGPVVLDRIAVAIDDDWSVFPLGAVTNEHAHHRHVHETDPPDVDAADIAAMDTAAHLAVRKQRDKTHDKAAAALLLLLGAFASAADGAAVLAVIDPAADRDTRRAAVAAEIARQARTTGHDLDWHTVARDAHTAAVLAGTAAAAHVASAGDVPVEPGESPFPDPFDPAGWVTQQQLGLAGDIVDAEAAGRASAPAPPDPGEDPLAAFLDDATEWGLEPDEVLALMDDGAGALYYLDTQVSDAYLGAQMGLYLDLGFVNTWWVCADGNACTICLGNEARSPYTAVEVPGVPHGGCRCWVTVS